VCARTSATSTPSPSSNALNLRFLGGVVKRCLMVVVLAILAVVSSDGTVFCGMAVVVVVVAAGGAAAAAAAAAATDDCGCGESSSGSDAARGAAGMDDRTLVEVVGDGRERRLGNFTTNLSLCFLSLSAIDTFPSALPPLPRPPPTLTLITHRFLPNAQVSFDVPRLLRAQKQGMKTLRP
jgi:hypothetical protein